MTLLNMVNAAFLQPLVDKNAANKLVTWEDLESSYASAQAILQEKSPSNTFIAVR